MKLRDLPIGARFRIPDVDGPRFERTGTLLKVNECRARVKFDNDARHVELDDGSSFDAPGRALDISPNTEVTEL